MQQIFHTPASPEEYWHLSKPSFCLPYFQYALKLIYQALEYVLARAFSVRACFALFRKLFIVVACV